MNSGAREEPSRHVEAAAGEWISSTNSERMLVEFLHPDLAERRARSARRPAIFLSLYRWHRYCCIITILPAEFCARRTSTSQLARQFAPLGRSRLELSAALANLPDDTGALLLMMTRFIVIGVDCASRSLPHRSAVPPSPAPIEAAADHAGIDQRSDAHGHAGKAQPYRTSWWRKPNGGSRLAK